MGFCWDEPSGILSLQANILRSLEAQLRVWSQAFNQPKVILLPLPHFLLELVSMANTWNSRLTVVTFPLVSSPQITLACQWAPDPGGNIIFFILKISYKKIGIKTDLESLWIRMAGWSGSSIQDLFSQVHIHVFKQIFLNFRNITLLISCNCLGSLKWLEEF